MQRQCAYFQSLQCLSQAMAAPPCPSQPSPKCSFPAIIWEGSLVSGALDICHHQNSMGAFRCSHAKAFFEALHHHRCWDWNSRVGLKLGGVGRTYLPCCDGRWLYRKGTFSSICKSRICSTLHTVTALCPAFPCTCLMLNVREVFLWYSDST